MARTPGGIAYDRSGPLGRTPVVLVHAGVADRRMWDSVWPALTANHDTTRLDLRGFGGSDSPPDGDLTPVDDVIDTMASLGLGPVHLVGASYGAGVAAEVAVSHPDLLASLVLVAPGGALIPSMTPGLRAFIAAEDEAMARHDLDAAVAANVTTWVDGPHRGPDVVDPGVRDLVSQMQRRAFELTADWDVEEPDLAPPVLDRLDELPARTLVLSGALDLDAIRQAAQLVASSSDGVTHVEWPDVAHLPSMERPDDFVALLLDWWAGQA